MSDNHSVDVAITFSGKLADNAVSDEEVSLVLAHLPALIQAMRYAAEDEEE